MRIRLINTFYKILRNLLSISMYSSLINCSGIFADFKMLNAVYKKKFKAFWFYCKWKKKMLLRNFLYFICINKMQKLKSGIVKIGFNVRNFLLFWIAWSMYLNLASVLRIQFVLSIIFLTAAKDSFNKFKMAKNVSVARSKIIEPIWWMCFFT